MLEKLLHAYLLQWGIDTDDYIVKVERMGVDVYHVTYLSTLAPVGVKLPRVVCSDNSLLEPPPVLLFISNIL
jgi:hypothetical protein